MAQVEIFTDGACSGNPGPGGWGAVLRCEDHEKELSGGEAETTNNRMELTAVIAALSALKRRFKLCGRFDHKRVGKKMAGKRMEKARQKARAQYRSVGKAAYAARSA